MISKKQWHVNKWLHTTTLVSVTYNLQMLTDFYTYTVQDVITNVRDLMLRIPREFMNREEP